MTTRAGALVRALWGAAWLLGVVCPAPASDPATVEDETGRHEEFRRRAREMAAEYEMLGGADGEEPFSLREEPLLHWSNPTVGTLYAGVFIWTANGRPEVIGSLHKWYSRPGLPEEHEFHSLSLRPLRAIRDGRDVWFPRAGIALEPLPDAPVPAESARRRLTQMKSLAGEFRAWFDEESNRRELRLLTQPLYRYESTDPDVVDGALFGFVQATDPEVLLLIEARRTAEGTRWLYAVARQNALALRVLHGDRVAAELPNCWQQVRDEPEAPYTALVFREPQGDGGEK